MLACTLVAAIKEEDETYTCFQVSAQDSLKRASRFSETSNHFGRKKVTSSLFKELGLVLMAKELDSTKESCLRQRVDPEEISKILEHQKCAVTRENRRKLRAQVNRGRKLRKICGPFPGCQI